MSSQRGFRGSSPGPAQRGFRGSPPGSAQRACYQVQVAKVVSETADACSLVLDVPAELAEAFAYRPGQFLTFRVPLPDGGSVARCYSLSSSPHAGEQPTVTVKRTHLGYASNWIADHVTAGTMLDVLPPAGTFTPNSLDQNFLLFAGGSGITPVASILKSALLAGRGRIALIYANANEASVIFGAELRRLQMSAPDRLIVVHWLDELQGSPSVPALRELARPHAGYGAYLCGPDPYLALVKDALRELGVPPGQVHTERFLSLAENPFEADEPTDGVAAMLRVDLDDAVYELDWPGGRRMLDVMLDAGLDAPYSCREGVCGACACRLVSGQVDMAHNEALEEQDLADGYVLACQSLAVTPDVTVSYN